MAIRPEQVLSGSYGTVYLGGQPLIEFNEVELTDNKTYEKILIPGQRRVGHKLTQVEGTGVIRGYRISKEFMETFAIIGDDEWDPVCQLEFYVEDPEADEPVKVRISDVKFTKNDILRFKAGEIVTEDWEFNFDSNPEIIG